MAKCPTCNDEIHCLIAYIDTCYSFELEGVKAVYKEASTSDIDRYEFLIAATR